jgi:hypothetical protein
MPSTVIRHFRYDPDTRCLFIVFRSGRRYLYSNVPFDTYAELQEAASRGAYFNQRIRDHFPFRELDEDWGA